MEVQLSLQPGLYLVLAVSRTNVGKTLYQSLSITCMPFFRLETTTASTSWDDGRRKCVRDRCMYCCPSKLTSLVPRPSLFVICRPALVESFVSTGRRCSIYHRFMLTGAFLDRRDSGSVGRFGGKRVPPLVRSFVRSFVGLCGLIRVVLLSRYFSPPPAS